MLDFTSEEQKIIDIAESSRSVNQWNLQAFKSPITTIEEAFEYLSTYHQKSLEEQDESFFGLMRAALRQICLQKIITDATEPTVGITFDGYGDSGNHHYNDTYDPPVRAFLDMAMDTYVTFDWYNNDGGFGDLTWHLADNKIIINGYTNYTETHQKMDEEEF